MRPSVECDGRRVCVGDQVEVEAIGAGVLGDLLRRDGRDEPELGLSGGQAR